MAAFNATSCWSLKKNSKDQCTLTPLAGMHFCHHHCDRATGCIKAGYIVHPDAQCRHVHEEAEFDEAEFDEAEVDEAEVDESEVNEAEDEVPMVKQEPNVDSLSNLFTLVVSLKNRIDEQDAVIKSLKHQMQTELKGVSAATAKGLKMFYETLNGKIEAIKEDLNQDLE